MIQFHETKMGQKFFMGDFPKFIKEVGRLADAIEESNRIAKEKEAKEEKKD